MYAACYSAKELCHNPNPVALGSRWLAYADKKVSFTVDFYLFAVLFSAVLATVITEPFATGLTRVITEI